MQVSTKAIVISSVKYGDHGLIVKCFTYTDGLKSYLLQGIQKNKKGKISKSQFLPLSLLKINATHNTKGNLNRIAEAKVLHLYKTLHLDFVKQSLVFFLSEFLSSVIKEEEGENTMLFDFLEQAFLWLDEHEQIANFHLRFLLDITRFLGFYPDEVYKETAPYFDLSEGKYVFNNGVDIIQGDQLCLFNKALGIKFDVLEKTLFSKEQRLQVLETIIKYYQLHMTYFKKPRSLEVLSKVLE